ncbi:MAG: hypothetical protein M1829_004415 [Trizodia sp. TS-e1964]|nr:MAG: hypothetical protein M1829_004415 [Trizodia sp. TS-e1964]
MLFSHISLQAAIVALAALSTASPISEPTANSGLPRGIRSIHPRTQFLSDQPDSRTKPQKITGHVNRGYQNALILCKNNPQCASALQESAQGQGPQIVWTVLYGSPETAQTQAFVLQPLLKIEPTPSPESALEFMLPSIEPGKGRAPTEFNPLKMTIHDFTLIPNAPLLYSVCLILSPAVFSESVVAAQAALAINGGRLGAETLKTLLAQGGVLPFAYYPVPSSRTF